VLLSVRFCTAYSLFLALSFLVGCAVPGSITGGDKDVTPPRILSSDPINMTTGFSGSSITLNFDEYVRVAGAGQKLLVAPPFEQTPVFSMRNKAVTIKWEGALLEQTTYVFNFADGIVDVNEGNPLDSNVFVFSTGDFIDSMTLEGTVIDAYTLEPVKDVMVMLYSASDDSLPYRALPRYFGKTDETGAYHIDYLASGDYKVFALEAVNTGYLFDLPNERIGFLKERLPSQLPNDSTNVQSAPIRLFGPPDTLQYIKSNSQIDMRGLEIVFHQKVGAFEWKAATDLDASRWKMVWNSGMDTLHYWFDEVHDYDSILLELNFDGKSDTLSYRKPSKFAKIPNAKKGEELPLKMKQTKTKYSKSPLVVSNTPIEATGRRAWLISGQDSMDLEWNKLNDLEYAISNALEPGKGYKILLVDSFFCDPFGACNDSVVLSFSMTTQADYGDLKLTYNLPEEGPHIIQILDDQGKVKRSHLVGRTGAVSDAELKVGKYRVRVVEDRNGNGVWDTGDYAKGVLPERVAYYESLLEVRSGWLTEIEWNLIDF
jgi:hypothetical protein